MLRGCRRWCAVAEAQGPGVKSLLTGDLTWLVLEKPMDMDGKDGFPKKLCWRQGSENGRWDVNSLAEDGGPCAGPPLCITLYYGY